MKNVKLYGIGNCDKVKRARRWLDEKGIDYIFHDYKWDGVDRGRLKIHIDKFGWEIVTNRRGTTWRKLSDEDKAKVVDPTSAIELLCANPSIIKRPILEVDTENLIDFDERMWSNLLG